MRARRFLCVDGDFFCHRTIHGMRIINKDITLDTSTEMNNFGKALINSVHSMYETFVNEHHQLIDQIIFVFDDKSWRKNVTPFKPYYIKEDDNETPVGYKENRTKMKEDSSLNYDNFNICKDEFMETLRTSAVFPVFSFHGSEGDDLLIMLKEQLLSMNPDNKMIVFCTDGDLKQLLYNDETLNAKPDSVILFRNIRSGAAPEGEFVISDKHFTQLYGSRTGGSEDVMSAFIRASSNMNADYDEMYYKNQLFKINFKDKSGKANYERTPGAGVSIATPTLTLLTKMVTGDKKDNIFPIFRWNTKTGKSIRNVTENNLINVFKELEFTYNDESAQEIYNDKLALTKMLYSLRDEVNQSDINIQLIGNHFVHNRKLLDIRTTNYIPEEVKNKFKSLFNNYIIDGTFDLTLDRNNLSKIKQDFTDSANIFSQSLPDLPDDLKNFSDLI